MGMSKKDLKKAQVRKDREEGIVAAPKKAPETYVNCVKCKVSPSVP